MVSREIGDQIFLHSYFDEKFKSCRITVNFVVESSDENNAKFSLMAFLLRKSCKEFSKRSSIGLKLSELYGAELFSNSVVVGDCLIVKIGIEVLENCLALNEENLIEDAVKFLTEIIFNPKIENSKFDESDFKIEKENLISLVQNEFGSKISHSLNMAKKILFSNSGAGCFRYGNVEKINLLKNEEVAAAYHEMLSSSVVHITIVGKTDHSNCADQFSGCFMKIKRQNIKKIESKQFMMQNVKAEKLIEPVQQSILIVGFAFPEIVEKKKDLAILIAALIFGGVDGSKLFVNVRTKLSLCYFCFAKYLKSKRVIFAVLGTDEEKLIEAKKAVMEQFEEVKAGNFKEEEIEVAKKKFVMGLKKSNDFIDGIENFKLNQILNCENQSIEELIEEIEKIEKEEIVEAVKKMEVSINFSLTSGEV